MSVCIHTPRDTCHSTTTCSHIIGNNTRSHTIGRYIHIHAPHRHHKNVYTHISETVTYMKYNTGMSHTHTHTHLLQREDVPQHLTAHINVNSQTHTTIYLPCPGPHKQTDHMCMLAHTQVVNPQRAPQLACVRSISGMAQTWKREGACLYLPGLAGEADGVRVESLQTLEIVRTLERQVPNQQGVSPPRMGKGRRPERKEGQEPRSGASSGPRADFPCGLEQESLF